MNRARRKQVMVGPRKRVWKVLRDTDGERFVPLKKGCCFSGEFAERENEIRANKIYAAIKNFLDAILYPHATELFAIGKN